MTTIVYRNGILASDSLCTRNGVVVGEYEKIVDLHGFLMGGSGDLAKVCQLFEWFEAHGPWDKPPAPPEACKAKENEDYTIIFIQKTTGKTWELDNGGQPHLLLSPFMAIGSGRQLALGAMEMGASAEQAVLAAIKHDIYSGGQIRTLTVKQEES